MREILVFDKIRFISGLLLVSFLLTLYYFKLGHLLILLIIIFIAYDLLKSKIYDIKSFIAYNLILILLIYLYFYLGISSIYLTLFFFVFLSLNIFFIKNKLLFIMLIHIFLAVLIKLYFIDNNLIFFLILISFFNDTIAYLAGRYFRGPLIVPRISPNKTWSGTSFSFFFSFILIYLFNYNFYECILISASLFLGDLYFSYIKRLNNIKDFSNIIPGHGGILDRIDSIFISSVLILFFQLT